MEAGVKRLVLFHHRPEHDDDDVDAMLEKAQATADHLGSTLEVVAAHEGLELTL